MTTTMIVRRGLVLAGFLATAVGLLVATSGAGQTPATGASVSARAADSGFSILGRPPSPADADAKNQLASIAAQNPTLAVSAARRLMADEAGVFWLVPTTDGQLCLARRMPPGNNSLVQMICTDAQTVRANGLAASGAADGVWGIVPDGVGKVARTTDKGATVAVPVTTNAYRAPSDTKSISFVDPGGARQGFTVAGK